MKVTPVCGSAGSAATFGAEIILFGGLAGREREGEGPATSVAPNGDVLLFPSARYSLSNADEARYSDVHANRERRA
jgi:hypothetical protein